MPNYVQNVADVEFGGGDLKVNKTDSAYSDSDFGKFVSLGGTDKESGGVLRFGEKRVKSVFRENDKDDPAKQWVEGQDVWFETILLESSLENLVTALGEDINLIGNNTAASPKFKFFRGPTLTLPKRYPLIYTVPQEANPALSDILIMPSCEVIVGPLEYEFKDERARGIKLVLKLHRVLEALETECVANKSFEIQGVSPQPFASWTKTTAGTSTVTEFLGAKDQAVDAFGNRIDPIKTGLRSCKFTIDGSNNEASVSQTPTVESGKKHTFSFCHQADGPNKIVRVTLGSTNYDVPTDQTPRIWQKYSLVFTPSAGTVAVKVRGYSASTVFYVDDVSIIKVPESSAVSSLISKKYEIRRQYV
jgi:hypothetical protein